MKEGKFFKNGLLMRLFVVLLALAVVMGTVTVSAASNKITVTTKAKLIKAMEKSEALTITFSTKSSKSYTIPATKGSKNKKLVIKASKAKITNKAVFSSITVEACKSMTEKASGNTIILKDENTKFTVYKGKSLKKLTVSAKKAEIEAQKKTKIDQFICNKKSAKVILNVGDSSSVNVVLKKKTTFSVSGSKKSEVAIETTAKSCIINASAPIDVKAGADVKVNLNKGSEGSVFDSLNSVNVKINNKSDATPTVKADGKAVPTPTSTLKPTTTPTVTNKPSISPSSSDSGVDNNTGAPVVIGYSEGGSGGSTGAISGSSSGDLSGGGSTGGYSSGSGEGSSGGYSGGSIGGSSDSGNYNTPVPTPANNEGNTNQNGGNDVSGTPTSSHSSEVSVSPSVTSGASNSGTPIPTSGEEASGTPIPTSGEEVSGTPIPTSGEEASGTPIPTSGEEASGTPIPTSGEEVSGTPIPTSGEEASGTPIPTSGEEVSGTPIPTSGEEVSGTPIPTSGEEVSGTPIPTSGEEASGTPIPTSGEEISGTPIPTEAINRPYTAKIKVEYKQSEARSMLTLINNYRDSHNCIYNNLQYDYELEKAAMQRAAELAVRCESTRPDGQNYLQTLAEYGFDVSRRGGIYGQNYIYGSNDTLEDINDAFDAFISDDGQLENMMSGYTVAAIGHGKIDHSDFWVILFSTTVKNTESTSPVDGEVYVPLNIPDTLVNSISFNFVSGVTSVTVGSTVDAPLVVPIAEFSCSDLNEIELAPLIFESQDEFVSASLGKMTGIKSGVGQISATILNRTYNVDITVTDGG